MSSIYLSSYLSFPHRFFSPVSSTQTWIFLPMVFAEQTQKLWHSAFLWPVFYFVFNKASWRYPLPAALGKPGWGNGSQRAGDDKMTREPAKKDDNEDSLWCDDE